MAYDIPLRVAGYSAAIYFLAVTIFNVLYLRRTRRTAPVIAGPLVSVILPARNEERNIGDCIDHLLNQTYKQLEIIVVNDNSEDATGDIARELARKDHRVTVIDGRPLPTGWNGKQFACDQAVARARELQLL